MNVIWDIRYGAMIETTGSNRRQCGGDCVHCHGLGHCYGMGIYHITSSHGVGSVIPDQPPRPRYLVLDIIDVNTFIKYVDKI